MKLTGAEKHLKSCLLTWEEMMIQKVINEGGINADVSTEPGYLWVTNPNTHNTTRLYLGLWYKGMVRDWIKQDNEKFKEKS